MSRAERARREDRLVKLQAARVHYNLQSGFKVARRKRRPPPTPWPDHGLPPPAIEEGMLVLKEGSVVIFDDWSLDLVCLVRFTPFADMPPGMLTDIAWVTGTLVGDALGETVVVKGGEASGACCSGAGCMVGGGKGVDCGMAPGKEEAALKWATKQGKKVQRVEEFYSERFENMSAVLFAQMAGEVVESGGLGALPIEVDLKLDDVFAPLVNYSEAPIPTRLHQDTDANTYTYGFFAPIHAAHKESGVFKGTPATRESGFESTGGHLVLQSYGVALDFTACDGVVDVLWRCKDDVHGVMESQYAEGFSRFVSVVRTFGCRL
ncbi:hypothetical protein BDK51DRAFT_31890 [Blyttiomyces helicus]|uniref:Tet-like 2OG-Fe(II) oxygenase domain-containing protein n=1 Tax=Blyttiomyces helicus TaxID=388810 RepID=A0A4P9WI26_9FUNG|nr:hypothetical protein BDK51DRAFT_31890 [Blyttiomyces helicus]|eukprot:RKO90206.1 hypothetical protein BDK51DRAFT_31890 [Blyttiomyces helicus]